MRILIDADGCPVVDIVISVARERQIECLLLCDTSHVFEKAGVQTLTFSKGADSVDFALVNLLHPGDLVITQDYGLAAMCLARKARVLHQDGMEYTNDNIDALLLARHTAKKIRNSGGRLKGQAKRTGAQDATFDAALRRLLNEAEREMP
ncbi:MAG: YaiI/YqxD family protein [Oscillospiraceae bacterium]